MTHAPPNLLHYATPAHRPHRATGPWRSIAHIMLLAFAFALVGQAILLGLLGLFLQLFS